MKIYPFFFKDGKINGTVVDRNSAIAYAHEMGHMFRHHSSQAGDLIDLKEVKKEIEAWQTALSFIKNEHKDYAREMAKKCIATYNAACEATFGEWYEEREIEEALD